MALSDWDWFPTGWIPRRMTVEDAVVRLRAIRKEAEVMLCRRSYHIQRAWLTGMRQSELRELKAYFRFLEENDGNIRPCR